MLSAWSGQLSETKNSGRRQRHGQCDGLTVRYGVGSCSDLARHAVVFHTRSGALVREPGSVCPRHAVTHAACCSCVLAETDAAPGSLSGYILLRCLECAAFVARPARMRRRRGTDRADHAHPDHVDPRPSATATPGLPRAGAKQRPRTQIVLLRTPSRGSTE